MLKNILFIMLAFSLLCVCCAPRKQKALPKPDISEIRSVGKLTLAEMTIAKSGTIEDLSLRNSNTLGEKAKAMMNALKIGTRKGAYSYNTYMRAYIDMNKLTPSDFRVDSINKSVFLTLPAIETEFAGRDPYMEEMHYRVTGLRTNISASERAALKEAMNTELKSEVEKNPEFKDRLFASARAKAEAYFGSFYSDYGYETFVEFAN